VTSQSKKQAIVARSSAEAEYRGMANGNCELLWLQVLLTDLELISSEHMRLIVIIR